MKQKSLFIVECVKANRENCPFQLIASTYPGNNTVAAYVWCAKWRLQRDKETMIYGCHPDFPKHFLEEK